MTGVVPTLALVTHGPGETQALAARLAQRLEAGDVIWLSGDLGAGKTTFTQGLGRGLDIDVPINSPTFVLIREYAGRLPLYHIDLYRLNDAREVAALGLPDYLAGDGVCVLEWAERLDARGEMPGLHIRIEQQSPGLPHSHADDLMPFVVEDHEQQTPGLPQSRADDLMPPVVEDHEQQTAGLPHSHADDLMPPAVEDHAQQTPGLSHPVDEPPRAVAVAPRPRSGTVPESVAERVNGGGRYGSRVNDAVLWPPKGERPSAGEPRGESARALTFAAAGERAERLLGELREDNLSDAARN